MDKRKTIHLVHLLPVTNTEEHEKTENCKCNPRKESVGGTVKLFIHQAPDGQECCKVEINMGWSKTEFITT